MLRELLQPRAKAIARRWCEDGLTSYSPEALSALGSQQDRFANPLGHDLRVGTRVILDGILNGTDREAIRGALDNILRARAVQQMDASDALRFIFRLRDHIRAEVGDSLESQELRHEVDELERRIDEVVLMAFDVFTSCRERVHELRIAEVKRNTPWFVGKTSFTVTGGAG
jgi:hypothetical protein